MSLLTLLSLGVYSPDLGCQSHVFENDFLDSGLDSTNYGGNIHDSVGDSPNSFNSRDISLDSVGDSLDSWGEHHDYHISFNYGHPTNP